MWLGVWWPRQVAHVGVVLAAGGARGVVMADGAGVRTSGLTLE